MSQDLKRDAEIRRMLEAFHERTITPESLRQLEQHLRTGASARKIYREFSQMTGLLYWTLRGTALPKPEWLTAQPRRSDAPAGSPAPQPDATPAFPLLSLLGRYVPGGEFTVGFLLVFAVISAIGGVAFFVHRTREQGRSVTAGGTYGPLPTNPAALGIGTTPSDRPAIARVTEEVDCVWRTSNGSAASVEGLQAATLHPGQSLELVAGVAEVMLTSGVRVTVEGPSRLTLVADGLVELHAGQLVAMVPPAGVGFVVQTPHLRLVDLGTEFGVAVSKPDATDVIVFRGQVATTLRDPITRAQLDFASGAPVVLKENQARRFSEDGRIAGGADLFSPQRFRRRAIESPDLSDSTEPRGVLVSQGKPVTASSCWGAQFSEDDPYHFAAESVVDGQFDDLTLDKKCSYWLALDARPAELTIDLETIYDIVEIRLQNTHNRHDQDRGARTVRISLSVDEINFAPAGEVDFANPAGLELLDIESIRLSPKIKARFVKLQFPNWHGKGSGLNEVQVFAAADEPAHTSHTDQ